MKLTYKMQLILSVIIIILTNILTEVFHSWIYRSLGFGLCGLLFIAHPVVPAHLAGSKQAVLWTRIAGVILILIGIFTRVHI